eukprot:3231345-Amphidinium_carterae.1
MFMSVCLLAEESAHRSREARDQTTESVRPGPTYDNSSPCGYHIAGYCRQVSVTHPRCKH